MNEKEIIETINKAIEVLRDPNANTERRNGAALELVDARKTLETIFGS